MYFNKQPFESICSFVVRKSENEQEYIALEKCLVEINLQCIFKVLFKFYISNIYEHDLWIYK